MVNQEDKINKFTTTLIETNRAFNFYVNWFRPEVKIKKYKLELNILNSLIMNENYDEDFRRILKVMPTTVNLFPTLFALSKTEKANLERKGNTFKVVNASDFSDEEDASFEEALLEYNFWLEEDAELSDLEIEKYLDFTKKMGIKYLFMELLEKHLLDYVVGCEVGLDSNARKNRGGMSFELALTPLMEKIAKNQDMILYTQKKLEVLEKHNFSVSKDISNRITDFLLVKNNRAINIEANFFGSTGSKPQEIIDAYINRQSDLKKSGIDFALITDGSKCWGSGDNSQLEKGFKYLNCLLNYNMTKEGMLEEFIVELFNL